MFLLGQGRHCTEWIPVFHGTKRQILDHREYYHSQNEAQQKLCKQLLMLLSVVRFGAYVRVQWFCWFYLVLFGIVPRLILYLNVFDKGLISFLIFY